MCFVDQEALSAARCSPAVRPGNYERLRLRGCLDLDAVSRYRDIGPEERYPKGAMATVVAPLSERTIRSSAGAGMVLRAEGWPDALRRCQPGRRRSEEAEMRAGGVTHARDQRVAGRQTCVLHAGASRGQLGVREGAHF